MLHEHLVVIMQELSHFTKPIISPIKSTVGSEKYRKSKILKSQCNIFDLAWFSDGPGSLVSRTRHQRPWTVWESGYLWPNCSKNVKSTVNIWYEQNKYYYSPNVVYSWLIFWKVPTPCCIIRWFGWCKWPSRRKENLPQRKKKNLTLSSFKTTQQRKS